MCLWILQIFTVGWWKFSQSVCLPSLSMIHWVCFLFFLGELIMLLAPVYSAVFRRLIHLGSLPACWRQVNVTPIPKGPPSSSVANYRPISITSVLSNLFERLVSSSFTIYGTQWCASNHPVCLYKRSGYLWCTFVRVLYTVKCIAMWAGG